MLFDANTVLSVVACPDNKSVPSTLIIYQGWVEYTPVRKTEEYFLRKTDEN